MIIILKGGTSAEREVSLWTAKTISDSLRRSNFAYVEIDAADSDWLDQVGKYANPVVIIALHGPFGEDGQVQRLLEEKSIRYTGSDSVCSALAINKDQTKQKVRKLGISTPSYKMYMADDPSEWEGIYPVIVKPNEDGSSFGVTLVKSKKELPIALKEASKYGAVVMVEEYIEGIELTCGVVEFDTGVQALPLVEIWSENNFFNFEAKYTAGKAKEICPASIDEGIKDYIQKKSIQIFNAIGASQYARVDWILKGEIPYFLEINTLPGMTKTSLLPKEFHAAGIEYDEFVRRLIQGVKWGS